MWPGSNIFVSSRFTEFSWIAMLDVLFFPHWNSSGAHSRNLIVLARVPSVRRNFFLTVQCAPEKVFGTRYPSCLSQVFSRNTLSLSGPKP